MPNCVRVPRHPVEHAGRRAHRIGAIEAHSRRRATHRQSLVAFEEGELLSRVRQGKWQRLEVRPGILITGARHADVFGDHSLAFPFELQAENVLEDFELDADQPEHGRQRDRVLHQVASNLWRQVLYRERTELDARSGFARLDLVAVVKNGGARFHQTQVTIHGVLIERHHDVELVAEAEHRLVAGAKREKDMAAAHDGLVGVVGVQVQPAAHENARQDIARRRNALTRRAADRNRKINLGHASPPFWLLISGSLRSGEITCGHFFQNPIHLVRRECSHRLRANIAERTYAQCKGGERLLIRGVGGNHRVESAPGSNRFL